jgi:hypothetical protein
MSKRQKGETLPGMPLGSTEETPKVDYWIEEMVGALFDPLIVWPSSWADDLPDWIKKELPLHRLAHLMLCSQGKAEWDEACDLEAMAYMFPRTLDSPLSESWSNIYIYLGTKVMGDKMPQDIRHETLTDYQMRELRDLKRFIYNSKVKARKERHRQEKAEQKAEEKKEIELVSEKCEKPRLF